MEQIFDVDGPVGADVRVPAGVVDVTESADGRVRVVLEPVRDSRRATQLVRDSEVSCTGPRLVVHVPDRAFRTVDVRCRLAVPAGSTLVTRTASADVRCEVSLRAFEGTTASGDTVLGDVAEAVSVTSASGDVECRSAGGRLALRTASGDVTVAHAGSDVDVTTASGDVAIGDASGSVSVRVASGDVRVRRARAGRVALQSASGDVTVGVVEGVLAHLDLTTVSGDTSSAMALSDAPTSGGTPLEIVVRTVSGDIRIERAGAPVS